MGRLAPDSVEELSFTLTHDAVAGRLTLGGESWTLSGSPEAPRLTPSRFVDEGDDVEASEEVEPALLPPLAEAMMASAGGPYASAGLPVVDLLIVYSNDTLAEYPGTESDLRALAIQGVVNTYNALVGSAVEGRVRLVGLEKIDWPQTAVHPDEDNVNGWLDAGVIRPQLRDADGIGDAARQLREARGADVVVGLTKRLYGASGTSPAPTNPGPSTAYNGYILLVHDQVDRSLGHELGHQASLEHWREELRDPDDDGTADTPVCEIEDAPQYRYGFVFPADTEPVDPLTPICGNPAPATFMANGATEGHTVNGVQITNFDRIYRYANPNLTYSWVCANNQTYTAPLGSTFQTPLGCSSQAALRLNETWPALEAYRPMKATVDGAVITSPPPGSALSTSATFQWTGGVSPTDTYWLEVYRPSTGTVYFDGMVVSSAGTVSQTVSGLPNNSDVLAARLWTYMGSVSGGPPQWSFKDYRYRSAAKLVSCSAEDPGMVPDSAYTGASCTGCSWSSSLGRVSCSLGVTGTSAAGIGRATSGFAQGDAFDLALWGKRSNGQDFCCLFHDPSNQVQAVWLTGWSGADDLAFLAPETGHQLQPWGQAALHGRIAGGSGADTISGSNSAASGYTEELRGGAGNDTISGNGGADTLFGEGDVDTLRGGDGNDVILTGAGADQAFGGTGNDTLIALGSSNGVVLRGEAGSDVLCADMFRVQMHGSTAGSGGFNTMYWSSTASGGLGDQAEGILASSNGGSYAWCGHNSHAAKLGWCNSATLTTVPTVCASYGLAQ